MMKYKGYNGSVEYDSVNKIFHGNIVGIKAVVTFQGKSVDELEKAFRESIDDYFDWCEECGIKPELPFSGKFSLRLEPGEHFIIAQAAKESGLSINKFVGMSALKEARQIYHDYSQT